MKLPKYIKVNKTKYLVTLKDLGKCYGECHTEHKRISINPKKPQIPYTWIHELIHAGLEEWGLTKGQFPGDEAEEAFVRFIERQIMKHFTPKEIT